MRIALLLSLLFAAGLSSVAVQDAGQPSLLVFCGPGPGPDGRCQPCDDLKRDLYGGIPAFADAMHREFSSIRMVDVRKFPADARRYRVDRWPTCVMVDANGNELKRVTGYTSAKELWQSLVKERPVLPISQSTPRKTPREPLTDVVKQPKSPPIDTTRNLTEQVECIDGVCRILKDDLTAVDESLKGLKAQSTTQAEEYRQRLQKLQQQLSDAKAASSSLQKRLDSAEAMTAEQSSDCKASLARLERLIVELNRKCSVVESSVAGSAKVSQVTPTVQTTPPSQPGLVKRIFRGLVTTAMEVGLTSAQSEVLVGLGAIGGPAGIAIAAGVALWRARKKKADKHGDVTEPSDASPKPAMTAADEFKIENLPLQHIDYTTCWAEHWRNQHADPATALKELELYVQAWQAVRAGSLVLPGIDNPQSVVESLNRWVNRQVTDHAQKALTSENTNHKVFYAHTWKEATHNIREGTFRTWKPNPPAADAIDDWVAARLTEKLTQTSTT